MAKQSVSRAGKAQYRPTKKHAPKARKIPADAAQRIRLELIGARATTMTVIKALQRNSLTDEIAVCLLRHVLGPLEAVLEMTT